MTSDIGGIIPPVTGELVGERCACACGMMGTVRIVNTFDASDAALAFMASDAGKEVILSNIRNARPIR